MGKKEKLFSKDTVLSKRLVWACTALRKKDAGERKLVFEVYQNLSPWALIGSCSYNRDTWRRFWSQPVAPVLAVPWAHPHPWCRLLPAGPQLTGGCWGALQLGRMLDLQPAAPRANGVRGWPQGRDTFQRWGNTTSGIRGLGLEVCMNQRRRSQQNAAAAADVSTLHSSRVNRYFSFYFD